MNESSLCIKSLVNKETYRTGGQSPGAVGFFCFLSCIRYASLVTIISILENKDVGIIHSNVFSYIKNTSNPSQSHSIH